MEYVTKKELSPYKEQFNDAIKYIKGKIDCKYQYRLVGSAKRNLVLRHHNKGFDLDYQIIFNQSIKGQDYKAIKKEFMGAFNSFFTKCGYKNAEDSTSAITIKKIDESEIHDGYDITLLSPESDGLHIIRYIDAKKTEMGLELIKQSSLYQKKYSEIKGTEQWSILREIYKTKKENNNEGKKSFSLLAEAVKEFFDNC
jgi:hypothetical protein